jgi:hypothetical protein
MGSNFYFVEIDMRNLVSNQTLKSFQHVLKDRSKIRYSIKREEDNYENYVQTMYSKINFFINKKLIFKYLLSFIKLNLI